MQSAKTTNKNVAKVIDINIKRHTNEIVKVEARQTNSVLDVKIILSAKISIPPDNIILKIQGRELNNIEKLDQVGIGDDTDLEIEETPSQFYINGIHGNTIVINMKTDEKILALKQQIQIKTQIPFDEQVLFFAGKKLENNKSLFSYGIQDNATIQQTLRLRGVRQKSLNRVIDAAELIEFQIPITHLVILTTALLPRFESNKKKFDQRV
ncbi:MAG: hypothetical protein EZS28_010818 [Streblomastix strix]|uniref:Ubiquitin-like domain-containing protein n=1 Tax=Streblomastix strix TaxID=222440 RepID=A0A5J4WG03_9EUKA|nr:MAG: hypothetical protein EZS28_010818 [Streblomastix strix]